MVELARLPGLNRLSVQFRPISRRMGPFTMTRDAGGVGDRRNLVDAVGIVFEKHAEDGQYDGEILGQATGHDGVGRGLLRRQGPAPHGNLAQHVAGLQSHGVQHGLDPGRTWAERRASRRSSHGGSIPRWRPGYRGKDVRQRVGRGQTKSGPQGAGSYGLVQHRLQYSTNGRAIISTWRFAQGNRVIVYTLVTPAKAGVQKLQIERIVKVTIGFAYWIPAFAGMTRMVRLPCMAPLPCQQMPP